MSLTYDERHIISGLTEGINRIATALEVLAADVTERRARAAAERLAGLQAEHERLRHALAMAEEIDDLAKRRSHLMDATAVRRGTAASVERIAEELRAFEAAHPELVNQAVPA